MSGKVKKKCRVCGKLYTPCVSCENDKSIFHWRAVACSPECAREYIRRVEKARNSKSVSLETDLVASKKNPILTVCSDVIKETEDTDVMVEENANSTAPRKRNRKKKSKEDIEQIENEWVY